jgi:hypothetical protein
MENSEECVGLIGAMSSLPEGRDKLRECATLMGDMDSDPDGVWVRIMNDNGWTSYEEDKIKERQGNGRGSYSRAT